MINPNLPLSLIINGSSLSPSCGLVVQIERKHVTVIEEIYLKDSGSLMDVAAAMVQKYGGNKYFATFETTPAKDGKANWSDSVLLYNYLLPHFKTLSDKSYYNEDDKRLLDAVNALNNILSCTTNDYRLSIAAGAKFLVRDLEQVTYQPGSRKLNEEDKSLGHLSACLQIIVYRLFPMTRTRKERKSNIPPENTGARLFWNSRHKKKTVGKHAGYRYDLSGTFNAPRSNNGDGKPKQ